MSLSDSRLAVGPFLALSRIKLRRARMTGLIAWRNLVHDRMRFGVTIVGIAFATL